MNKILGILLLLVFVCAATTLLSDNFITPYNLQNNVRHTALHGIIGIGVSLVIITGGIDLSIGSLIGLTGCILPMLLIGRHWPAPAALAAVMAISLLLGLAHGLLITKLNLQPFIVTLCGLLIYRGVARWMTRDQTQGFGTAYDNSLRLLATGKPCSVAFLIMLFGIFVVGWSGWRWRSLRAEKDQPSETRSLALAGVIVGLVLAVVGSSRFWRGVVIEPGTTPLAIGVVEMPSGQSSMTPLVIEIPRRTVRVPVQAVDYPQTLMRWCGLGAIPCVIWLIWAIAGGNPRRLALPAFALLGAAVAVWWVTRVVRQPDEQFWPNENWAGFWRMLSVSISLGLLMAALGGGNPRRLALPAFALLGAAIAVWWVTRLVRQPDEWFWPTVAWAQFWRMTSVLLSLGLLMASLGWFYKRSLATAGDQALAPLLLAGFFAILWLLGRTRLGETLVPAPVIILIVLATLAAVFLNQTIYGRYLLALGRNEQAARYSGINTDRMIILAYVLCGGATGIGGILFSLDSNSVQPAAHGSFLELYAIAAAVLGGCSLRGGEGNILGVIIGAAVMRVLYNAINILGIPTQLEYAIIGAVILCGVLADELVRRIAAGRSVVSALTGSDADADVPVSQV